MIKKIKAGKGAVFNEAASSDIRNRFSGEIMDSVSALRQVTGKQLAFPVTILALDAKMVNLWAEDILSLKKLICALPGRLSRDARTYSGRLAEDKRMSKYLRHDSLSWVSPFFRPDCILTADGPKILEFNIDNGSMAFAAGVAPKLFYRSIGGMEAYLSSSYGTNFNTSFSAETVFGNYLKCLQDKGRAVHIWDIEGRSESVKRDRAFIFDLLRSADVDLRVVEGKNILDTISPGNYYFRYFAYLHYFYPESGLGEVFFGFSRKMIDSSDISASSVIYDDKLNMAALWSKECWRLLSEGERRLVREYIPRSYSRATVTDAMLKTILHDKDRWVIKSGNGFQGKAVYMGQDLPPAEWTAKCGMVMSANNYMFQECAEAAAVPVEVTDGEKTFPVQKGHIMNFYFVNNSFAGLLFRFRPGGAGAKIGAIDSVNVVSALPVLL